MTFLAYIEYQNFTRIHIEELILQALIHFEESNCYQHLFKWDILLNNNINTFYWNNSKLHNILIYVLLSIWCVSYHFEDNRILSDILKYLYTFPRLDNCNYRSISDIPSVFSTLYWPFTVGMYKDISKYH
jgi:hypothetical protein